MNPKDWGPHMWYILHLLSFTYPDNPSYADKRIFNDFYTNMRYLLPCSFCRKHYSQYISEYPIGPHLDRRIDLVKWVIQIHNFVNLSLGKPQVPPEAVINFYQANQYKFTGKIPDEYLPPKGTSSEDKWRWWMKIFLIGLAIGVIVYLRNLELYNWRIE